MEKEGESEKEETEADEERKVEEDEESSKSFADVSSPRCLLLLSSLPGSRRPSIPTNRFVSFVIRFQFR